MADSLAGLVLAAGAGTRLWPLTSERPKPLCPVGDRTLLDHALDQVVPVVAAVAVNVHHGAHAMIEHLQQDRPGVHCSLELPVALGTAGAVGKIAGWLDGRSVLVVNADTWHGADLGGFVQEWDQRHPAVLTDTPGRFGPHSSVVASIVPAAVAAGMGAEPSGLWETLWRAELSSGTLQTVRTGARTVDCGTPGRYLLANMRWLAERSGGRGDNWVHPSATVTGDALGCVIGRDASVAGRIRGCVVWPGSEVLGSEDLTDTVRAGAVSVMVRPGPP